MNGGYCMLDLGEVIVGTETVSITIPGIYEKIRNLFNVRKPLVVYGINAEFESPYISKKFLKVVLGQTTSFIVGLEGYEISITANDTVEIGIVE
jgi:hypothetical protein